ncbi:MAG: HAD family phosphatase [Erysipelotrichia bacterium]|nr:HAD family phosphatase [Erysipelotrichia bacterium]
MINTVIFDLDGLLVDSETVFYQLYQDLLSKYKKGFSKKEYGEKYCGRKLINNINDIIADYQLPLTFEQVEKFIADDEEEYIQKGIPLKKGAKELLDYLREKGYKIVLATSSLPERALRILDFNHVTDYFKTMIFGPDVKNGKPHPDVFLLAAQKAQADVTDCLVLEDSQQGITAAFNAGIKVICIPDVKYPPKDVADLCEDIYTNLAEVITYLEINNKKG